MRAQGLYAKTTFADGWPLRSLCSLRLAPFGLCGHNHFVQLLCTAVNPSWAAVSTFLISSFRKRFNPLLPISIKICFGCFDCSFAPNIANQLMSGTNVETSPVVLSSTLLSMLAAVLAVERDGGEGSNFGFFDPPKRAPLCGFTTHASRSHYRLCTHRTVKALQIAGSGLLASHELTEQELKIKNLTLFSFLSLSPASAAAAISSWWEASSSMGNMYPCCFGPMLLALHARLEVGQFRGALGNKGLRTFVQARAQAAQRCVFFPTCPVAGRSLADTGQSSVTAVRWGVHATTRCLIRTQIREVQIKYHLL